jgi:tRNA nucleotidyltransferase/poly(A) polymerase
MFTFYEVGGKVRDELLGLQSKDIDYVAVPDESFLQVEKNPTVMFYALEEFLSQGGYEIFLSTVTCFTIRAKFPKDHQHAGTVADFVMARKEVGYVEGTRTPIVEPGSLYDDLIRRDFTINAIAKASDGTLIDPFGGQKDLKSKILRTPLDPKITFNDDPLRLLRAIRFAITKNLTIHSDIWNMIRNFDYKKLMPVVSEERIREELYKCFKHDTLRTLGILCDHPKLAVYIFDETKLWLKPTNEQ